MKTRRWQACLRLTGKTMEQKNIRTSVLISTYNWPEALKRSVGGMLSQTVMPGEIVIADDGSGPGTAAVIDSLRAESPVPIIHVWQEDRGFRKSMILNKAIARMTGDYVLQIDGDVIPSRHFVSDHLELAERGFFVCGSRVRLSPEVTRRVLSDEHFRPTLFNMPLSFAANSLRSRLLRHWMATRYGRRIDHLRGCNMAFWRDDLIRVNGFNEDLTQWGHEDGEIAFRLHFAGVGKKSLKMGGCVYHLYHPEASRSGEQRHLDELERVKQGRISRCDNGIDKYLKQ